jgi:hypothetical protein
MTHLLTALEHHRLWLAIALLMLSLLSSSASLNQAADNEFGGRYQAGEMPPGLTSAEWVPVRAHIELKRTAKQAGTTLAADLPVQQAYVKASNTGAQDWFGYAVALSGDNSARNAGAVYVFTRSPIPGWTARRSGRSR